ncbi:NAD(P)/FAD-dependent oxidoreductase [Natronoglomus mannanivorans]|uniref:NAD(P)-binding domain-containing protein n=1 Tax=Natronoglomus mannanivorans TaxID=2979990 RepID=A0AAP2YWN7_9EURY|nr:NAD(P)-binding domain-containing protein [Halobacteria archaeon AArc-xg1-1]
MIAPDLEVAVVGAGPAGIGTAVALERLDIDYAVLERDVIGASFRQWPAEMRLLTPSFPGNAFGARDLNAITLDTSPALALDCEHPTGDEYAEYLEAVADFHDVRVETGVDVECVVDHAGSEESADETADEEGTTGFTLETNTGPIRARFVIWAAGQCGYPADGSIPGGDWGVHVASIDSWADHADRVDGADAIVVGGAESGIDAAIGLAIEGLAVTVLDDEGTWQYRSPDPSEVLSPRTNERLARALEDETVAPIELVAGARVDRLECDRSASGSGSETGTESGPQTQESYVAVTTDGERYEATTPPILATGFEGSLGLVAESFAFENDNDDCPLLTDRDESTTTPGLFLVGPQVAHDGQSFCFIYKFRQRFAVVAETIGDRLGVDTDSLEEYREKRMFLEDLECCEPDYCDC